MTFNKKHCLIFLAISVILLIGMTLASATEVKDVNNTQKITDDKDLSTSAKYDVDKMVKSEASTTGKDAKVEVEDTKSKFISTETNITENKEITKNSKTNNKQATGQNVENYEQLSQLLTDSTETNLEVNLIGAETYTGNGRISVNSNIKNLTINGNSRTIDFGQNSGFITITSVNLTLNNITIKNCKDTTGAVIYASGSYNNITITDSKFEQNTANVGGVIAVVQNSKVSIVHSVLSNNSAGFGSNRFGGVINIKQNSRLSIVDSVLSYNKAAKGGVIYSRCEGSARNYIDICNVTMMENDANYGGIIHNENTTTNIINSTIKFINNSAYAGSTAYGSSLYNYGSLAVLTVNNSYIDLGNDAYYKILNSNKGTINLDNNTIANSTKGTIIENDAATVNLINNNIIDNFIPNPKSFIENRGSSVANLKDNRINNNTCNYYFFFNYPNAAATFNIINNNITNNTANITYVNYNQGKYNITNNMIDNNTYLMFNLYNFGTATFSQNNVTNDDYLILNIENYGNQATLKISENNFTNNSGQRSLIINQYGIVTISYNNFTDNCLTNDKYLIIDSFGGGTYNIDNNIFVNNTNNKRDMLIYEDASTTYNVANNNVYIDNFLEDNITSIDPISIHGDEDKPILVNVNLRHVYNNVIVNGTIILYDENNQELNRSDVTNGVALVTIPTKMLSLGLNNLNVTYETLSKHYQNNSIKLEVTRTVDPFIVVEDSYETELYSPVEIVGHVYNQTGEAITSGIVNLTINEETFETTFEDGRFNLTYSSNVAGEFIITAKYYENEEDSEPKIVNEDKTVTVKKIKSIITVNVNPTRTLIGENVTIYGSLTDKLNNNISNRYVNIFVDGKIVANVKTNSNGEFNYSHAADTLGEIIVNATFNGDTGDRAMYDNSTNYTSFFVYNMNTSVLLNVSDINYTDTEIINFTVNETGATGNVKVEVTSDVEGFTTIKQSYEFTGEVLQLPLTGLQAGTYYVTVSYEGNGKYNSNFTQDSFKVNKNGDYKLNVTAQNIMFGEDEILIVYLPSDAKGLVTVNVTGMNPATINMAEGNVLTIPGSSLLPGLYEVNISYTDDNYLLKTNHTSFTVSTPVITIYDSQTIYVNESANIHGSVNSDSTILQKEAKIKLNISGNEYVLSLSDYDKGFTYQFTEKGTYTANATLLFSGKTITTSDNIEIVVNKIPTTTTIKVLSNTMQSTYIDITVKENAPDKHTNTLTTGKINLTVGNTNIPVTLKGENTTICLNDYITSAGNVKVNAVYPESEQYLSSSANVNINVRKLNTTLTVDATSPIDVGKKSKITGKLLDENNKPISNAKIVIKVDNKIIANINTDKNGEYTFNYDKITAGTHNITSSYEGNQTYQNSTAKTQITANKIETQITIEDIDDVTITEKINIKGKLTDKYNNPISNANITITMGNDKTTAKTDNKGNYNATLTAKSLGNKTINAAYTGNNKYLASKANTKIKVQKIQATITLNVPKTITLNDIANITGKVRDTKGNSIAGIQVNITVNSKTYTTKTDKNGNYKITNVNKVPGQNIVTATTGNNTIETITTTKTFNTRKINTTLTINPHKDVIVGQKVNVTGKLVDEKNNPIAKAKVTVTLDDVSKTVQTDKNGKYNAVFTTNTVGQKKITATYNGNDTYNNAKAQNKVNIVKNNATLTVKTPGDAIANKTQNITGTLKDKNGKAVANTPVTVTLNGKKYTAITDAKGKYQVEANNIKVGQNNLTVSSTSDKYNIKSVTTKFNARLLKSKITVNKVSDTKMGDNITITGKLTDEQNNPIKDAKISLKVNNQTYEVRTDNKGNYKLENPDLTVGTDNVTASYTSTQYKPSSAKTTFKVSKLKTKVIVESINGTIGEDIILTAYVTDERGDKVTGGNLVFKLNGKTLRVDGRFDTDASPLKIKVENGVVKYTIKADLYLRNGKNITASYSGSYRYEESKGNVAQANIKKRTASIKVTVTPKRAKQNSEIVFTATLTDVTPNGKNTTCLTTGGDVVFKVNGVSIKDNKGKVKRVNVNSSTVNLAYYIPSGMGGMDANGVKNYTVEAVYNNSMFYPDTKNSTIFNVQQSIVNINFIKTSVKNNVLSVKATFTDYENKLLIGNNKVCVKINGKTYQENNKIKYFTVTNGKVDLTGIQLAKGTTVKSVTLVTGEREGYLGARETTQNITKS